MIGIGIGIEIEIETICHGFDNDPVFRPRFRCPALTIIPATRW
jgi:hypothetical protein